MENNTINKVDRLSDDVYMISEANSTHCYLIIGSKKAVLFDMGYGYQNIMALAEEITDVPIMAVISHGDPDHGLGAAYCKEAYIHELDYGKLLHTDTRHIREISLAYREKKMPEIKNEMNIDSFLNMSVKNTKFHFLRNHDIIDLGDRRLMVLHIPGHSYGHIALWDIEKRRLFSGDMVTYHNVWYFLSSDEQAPFSMAKASYSMLNKMAKEGKFITIYPAHNQTMIPTSILEEYMECFDAELEKNYHNDKEFHSFMGNGFQHLYKHINIIYTDERLAEYIGVDVIQRSQSHNEKGEHQR